MLTASEVPGRAAEAAEFLESSMGAIPPMALVLGSGWGEIARGRDVAPTVDFDSVPGFGAATVRGHRGCVRVVTTEGGPLLLQEGRLHCHEGYSPLEVSFPVWAYHYLGVKVLVMLSAAGGLNPVYQPGDLMIVSDQIYLLGENPLIGVPEVEGRSVHLSADNLYPERWQDVLEGCLTDGSRCERGVYTYVTGPSYETPSEARMLRVLGGDAVGMSTAPEAITASFLGIEVAAMCCITNTLLPPYGGPLSHQVVLEAVRAAAGGLSGFMDRLAAGIDMIM